MMKGKELEIKMKVDVMGTLRGMSMGQTATLKAREFAPQHTVASAVSRLNRKEGRRYVITNLENGTVFTVKREA